MNHRWETIEAHDVGRNLHSSVAKDSIFSNLTQGRQASRLLNVPRMIGTRDARKARMWVERCRPWLVGMIRTLETWRFRWLARTVDSCWLPLTDRIQLVDQQTDGRRGIQKADGVINSNQVEVLITDSIHVDDLGTVLLQLLLLLLTAA